MATSANARSLRRNVNYEMDNMSKFMVANAAKAEHRDL